MQVMTVSFEFLIILCFNGGQSVIKKNVGIYLKSEKCIINKQVCCSYVFLYLIVYLLYHSKPDYKYV